MALFDATSRDIEWAADVCMFQATFLSVSQSQMELVMVDKLLVFASHPVSQIRQGSRSTSTSHGGAEATL
jgi:hypothetical protein